MSFKSAIQRKLVAEGIIYLVKDAERKNILPEIVAKIEELSHKHLGSYSDKVQIDIVGKVLLPLCRELMKDSRESRLAYHAELAKAFTESDQSLRREHTDEGKKV